MSLNLFTLLLINSYFFEIPTSPPAPSLNPDSYRERGKAIDHQFLCFFNHIPHSPCTTHSLPLTPYLLPLPPSRDIPITFREKQSAIVEILQIYLRHITVLYRTVISLCYYCDITVISLWYIWNVMGGRTDADRNVWNGLNDR